MVKNGFKYILIFLGATFLLTGMLVLAARIPQSAIRENVKESATFLCEGDLFGEIFEQAESSKIDRYADAILLGIAYQYDSNDSLASIMRSSYYHRELYNENENLLTAVTEDCGANQQYLRYWHGSNAIVRPLLIFLNLKQIYVLNGMILALLVMCLLGMLLRERAYAPALGVLAGLILTSSWFVPLSLEYTWTYLWMLLVSVVGVRLILKERNELMGVLFLVSGMVTNYLDFLTTETLTLTVPLLLMLWLNRRQNEQNSMKSSFLMGGKAVTAWGFGYAGMWMMKWLLASIVLSENVMPYVSEHIEERIGGNLGIGFWRYLPGAISNNIKCLFPLEYGIIGAFIGIAMVLFVIYTGYVYHGKKIDWKYILLYALIGLIPYIRYVVLQNHSYLHNFFTYRAQLATVLAIVLILEQLTKRIWKVHK